MRVLPVLAGLLGVAGVVVAVIARESQALTVTGLGIVLAVLVVAEVISEKGEGSS